MIIAVHGHEIEDHESLFEQMFRLRARSFDERRKWSVEVKDGLEIDRFDEMNPLYVMSISPDGDLLASLRLLPSTGPHMLSDVFPETMTGAPIIRHPLIWESSRFCVDTDAIARQTGTGLHTNTGEILLGLFEVAQQNAVENIVSVYDVLVERILRRAGCSFERLGEPFAYDGLYTVAGFSPVSNDVIQKIRIKSEIEGDIFSPPVPSTMSEAS